MPHIYLWVNRVKFGRKVKFVVSDDVLEEYQIADDVQKISELFDKVRDKSGRVCVVNILNTMQASANQEP